MTTSCHMEKGLVTGMAASAGPFKSSQEELKNNSSRTAANTYRALSMYQAPFSIFSHTVTHLILPIRGRSKAELVSDSDPTAT